MFFLFKKNQKHQNKNFEQQKIAQSVVNRCIILQDKASRFLQHKSERLTITAKRITVVTFCLLSFTCCFYLIVKSFISQTNQRFTIGSIKVPRNTQEQFQKNAPFIGITKKDFDKIQALRLFIDNLPKTKEGKMVLDSILINSPGLIDSLAIIENIYQSQSLNK